MSIDKLLNRYKAAGQEHLLNFWSKLDPAAQKDLATQLEALDIERVNRIYTRATKEEAALKDPQAQSEVIEPLPKDATDTVVGDPEKVQEWRSTGLDAISRGHVGVLLLAGGQGTRLGSSAPKGCYDIGLPSNKSLFQYQAERIARLQRIAEEEKKKPKGSVIIPWYVMTSGPTRRNTEEFFKENSYFGLAPANVIFFEQGTLPCLTTEGKVILETPSRVAVAPDGNGGVYAATRAPLSPTNPSSVLDDLKKRGILYVHVYCVDNCLVRVADPIFLGYGIQKQADCAAKVVPKASPTESVGVVARRGNKYGVVEYSEISKEQAERRDPETGELSFRAGNIVNHFYTTNFLQRVEQFEEELAFHIARKKIPYVDLESGETIKPAKPNGMKLEMFVFDVFPFSQNFAVLEVERREEFSPLKNGLDATSDNPVTSRRDLLAQHKRFLERAGATVKDGVDIELSPLVTYAGEGLESVKGKTFTKSGRVDSVKELDTLL
ncbi:hypothetical protein NP233_g8230 [Leucocoprinus birnbaumii]|uniref:UDP-N-acetylglucosamine diphosphorylase n=1 Tax=Leucocoprinus birnbaumii TaxID=56174 RepID=A0AAD5VPB8_9AGAR|nr:hypothetical protein NP233_g8230 [Leucocoprinus birnbaumii]